MNETKTPIKASVLGQGDLPFHCDACVWTSGNPFGVRPIIKLKFCKEHAAMIASQLPETPR